MRCRHCSAPLQQVFADLGTSPPSNAYLQAQDLNAPEAWYPLRVLVCNRCWLVQTEDFAQADQLFSADYAYFSGFSTSWLAHARRYVTDSIARFGLNAQSLVVEVAANDGYLLQYVQEAGIPCLGVEPTASTAAAARSKGLTIVERFFGVALARELVAQGQSADLMAANNVLAHVPDINDFVAGFALLLKPQGVATFEFPHALKLVQSGYFDTLYHEHFSYLSLSAVRTIFLANGLTVVDVEQLETHGGSLRVYARRTDSLLQGEPVSPRVAQWAHLEQKAGLETPDFYAHLQVQAEKVAHSLLQFLIDAKQRGKKVAAYGAAAKGNTLLNFAGVRPNLLAYVVDLNPAKQGKFMPGSRIPIVDEQHLKDDRPDYLLVLPWNLSAEVQQQLDYVNAWGGKLLVALPELKELP
jgi:SAM-dependent methyltransferase